MVLAISALFSIVLKLLFDDAAAPLLLASSSGMQLRKSDDSVPVVALNRKMRLRMMAMEKVCQAFLSTLSEAKNKIAESSVTAQKMMVLIIVCFR